MKGPGWLLAAQLTVLTAGVSSCTLWPLLDGVPYENATPEQKRLERVQERCGPVIDEQVAPQKFPIRGFSKENFTFVYQRKDGGTAWLNYGRSGIIASYGDVFCSQPPLGPNGVYGEPEAP